MEGLPCQEQTYFLETLLKKKVIQQMNILDSFRAV